MIFTSDFQKRNIDPLICLNNRRWQFLVAGNYRGQDLLVP